MKRAFAVACLLLALAVIAVGCGAGDSNTAAEDSLTSTQKATATTASEAPPDKPKKGSWGVVFGANSEDLGIILFDLSGHTLYRFDGDRGSTSSCYGACAEAWPPALTEGTIRAVDVPRDLVGTAKRRDGTVQLTYDGHPLYTHSGERQGRSNGDGVQAFGAEWHALRRTGKDATG